MSNSIQDPGSPRADASFKSPSRRNQQVAKAVNADNLPSSVSCRSEKQQREDKWREEFEEFKAEKGLSDDTKVFVICPPGGYQDVRDALEDRGWFENTDPESGCYDFKYVIRAKDLKNPMPVDQQQLNHFFNGGCLTTKTGLTASMKQLKWHQDFHQDEIFPRAYNISNPSDRQEFEIDFMWTAAEAILRRVQMDQGLHPAGVPVEEEHAVNCAIKVSQARLNHINHLRDPDLDWMGDAAPCLPDLTESEWSSVLDCSYFNFELSSAEAIPKEQEIAEGATAEGDEDGGDDDDDDDEAGQNDGEDLEPEPEPEEVSPEDTIPKDRRIVAESSSDNASDMPLSASGRADDLTEGAKPSTHPLPASEGASSAEGGEQGTAGEAQAIQDGTAPETQAAREERFKDVAASPLPEMTMALIDKLLAGIKETSPQYDLNGNANIWILKPGGKSRGRGIRCINKLKDVQRLADNNIQNNNIRARTGKKKSMWVAQKYMENPLTIRRRKFDIRQWVLVTDWNPLTVWFYGACYLRFAAEEYSLANFQNRFSHLTNNTIQVKSSAFEENDIGEGNMWDSEKFAEWLGEELGQPDAFQERIQPAMQRCIEASLSTVQDSMKHRKATHELFGYDFIIDENLGVWFLEVNCSPCLAHSTPVTGRLVSSMVEDMMKVLIDLPEARRQAKRGEFNIDEFDTGLWKRTPGSCGRNLPARQQPHVHMTPMQIQGSALRIKRRRSPKMTIDPDVDSVGWIPAKTKEASEQAESPVSLKGEKRRPLIEAEQVPAEAEITREEAPVVYHSTPAQTLLMQKDSPPADERPATRLSSLKDKLSSAPRLSSLQELRLARAFTSAEPVDCRGNSEMVLQHHDISSERRPRSQIYGRSSSTGLLRRQESQLRSLTPTTAYRMAEILEPLPAEGTRAVGSLSGQYAPGPVVKPREIIRFSSPSPVAPDYQGFSPAYLPKMRPAEKGPLKGILDNKPLDESSDEAVSSYSGRFAVLKPVTACLQKAPLQSSRSYSMLRSTEQRAAKNYRLELQEVMNPGPMMIPLSQSPRMGNSESDDTGNGREDQPSPSAKPQQSNRLAEKPERHVLLSPGLHLQMQSIKVDSVSELLETANEKRRLLNEYAEKLQYQKLPQPPVRRVGVKLGDISPLTNSKYQQSMRSSAPAKPRGPGMGAIHVTRTQGGRNKHLGHDMVSRSLPNTITPPKLDTCWDTQPLGKTSYVSSRADEAIKRLVGIS